MRPVPTATRLSSPDLQRIVEAPFSVVTGAPGSYVAEWLAGAIQGWARWQDCVWLRDGGSTTGGPAGGRGGGRAGPLPVPRGRHRDAGAGRRGRVGGGPGGDDAAVAAGGGGGPRARGPGERRPVPAGGGGPAGGPGRRA